MLKTSKKSHLIRKKSKIILGIDPGLANTGYGIICQNGNHINFIDGGIIKTENNQPIEKRLGKINKELKKIIKKFQPEILASEKLFFCKNVKTALKVGQAQGVILLTAEEMRLKISEFTPLQIKQAITGYGKATKSQIQQMVKMLLNLKEIPKPDDAADALAIAICCAQTKNFNKK